MSYVFYDTETTGLSPQFDQIIQFAAIKTDHEFKELDRINLRCRIQPHIIPSATALAINGITLEQCFDRSLPTYCEMLSELESLLVKWSPSVFAGWNSIKFDEEFLRFGFYQNLFQSFLTSLHNNSRLDVLKIAQASHSYDSECLDVPINENGNFTFALDELVRLNGHTPLKAHDALSDVQSMIHIARQLKKNAPHVWSQAVKYSNKATVNSDLNSGEAFVITESFQSRRDQYAVVRIGNDQQIQSQHFAADITRDYSQFLMLSQEEKLLWLNETPKAVRRIKATASPMLMPLDELDDFKGLNIDNLHRVAASIRSNSELCSELSKTFQELSQKRYQNEFIEQQLYDSLPDWGLAPLWQEFHRLPWSERTTILKKIPDARFRKFGLRLINEHAPDALNSKSKQILTTFISRKITGQGFENVPWRDLTSARDDLAKARKDPRISHEVEFFEQYELYLNSLADQLM